MFIFDKAPFPSCHASTLVEPARGRFLAAWFGGKAEGARDVKVWGSHFDGRAWTAPVVLAEEPNQPCWNPVLFQPARGPLALWYKAGPSPMTWTGFVKRSIDGGRTWSAAEIMPAGSYGPVKNKPIEVEPGVLLAGTSVESYRCWTSWVERSRDGGRTWQRFGPIAVPGRPYGTIQPTLLVTRRGILALVRSRGIGAICAAESADGGQTWSDARPIDLPNPNSGIDAVRASSGDFYLLYNHTRLGRSPLTLARSRDDGKTWRTVATPEDALGEFSYPAIIQGSDGKLHATWTWNRRHIKYQAFDPTSFAR